MLPDAYFLLTTTVLLALSAADDVFVSAINVQRLSSRMPAQNSPTLQVSADAAASHVYQCSQQPQQQQQNVVPSLLAPPIANVVTGTNNRHVYPTNTAKIFLPPYKPPKTAAYDHVPVVYSLLPSHAEQICIQLNCESRGFECIEVFAMRTSSSAFGVGAVCVRRRELVGGKPSDPCQAEQAICNDNERCVAVFPDCRPFRSKRRLKCVPLVSCQVAASASYLYKHNTSASSRDRGDGNEDEIYRDFVVPVSPSININNDNAHSIDYASAVVKASQPFESSSTFFEKLDDSNQKQDNTTLQHQGIALGPQFLTTTLEVKLINSTNIMPFKE